MATTSETGKVRFPVYLDPATVKALRMLALEEGTSATKIVERLIVAHLGKASFKRRTKA